MGVWLGRFNAWCRRHVLLVNVALAAWIALPVVAAQTSMVHAPGFLFYYDSPPLIWTLATLAPAFVCRRWPEASAAAMVAVGLAQLLLGPSMLFTDATALLVLYMVIVHGDPRKARAWTLLAFSISYIGVLMISASLTIGPLLERSWYWTPCMAMTPGECGSTIVEYVVTGASIATLFLVPTVVLGLWQRARMATIRMMRERNEALLRRERDVRQVAADAERARIARDMHDVVAHTLSIIIVQSDGGRYAGLHDAAVAKRTMDTIRRESQHALRDMQRLLGAIGGSAHPSYQDIDILLDQARAACPDITLIRRRSGTISPRLTAANSETLYRVVQEALSNVRKYAGPHVTVSITEQWNEHAVTVSIVDDGRGAGACQDGHLPGYGLTGMHERATAAGGCFAAGPGKHGGFTVCITLPLDAPAITADGQADSHHATQRVSGVDIALTVPRWLHRGSLRRMCLDLITHVRSRDINQATLSHGTRVERLSQWAERHYVLVDCLEAGLLTLMIATVGIWQASLLLGSSTPWRANTAICLLMVVPMALRRRFPESSAAYVAVLCALELLCYPDIPAINLLALLSLYCVTLYGRPSAVRWATAAALADAVLVGLKVWSTAQGHTILLGTLLVIRPIRPLIWYDSLMWTIIVILLSLATIASALWARNSGANALVLQAREQAITAEQEQQRILAANEERNRIAASIRQEVRDTLTQVIEQADEGLAMLQRYETLHRPADPQDIDHAFAAIGSQGRDALARMRELLRILRETGHSDGGYDNDGMQLSPAKPLDEQLHRQAASSRHEPSRQKPSVA